MIIDKTVIVDVKKKANCTPMINESMMLPAVGFALLMNMLWDNRLCVLLFLGFILATYLNLPIIAIAGIALTIGVLLVVQDMSHNRKQPEISLPQGQDQAEEEFFNE